ncbi:hypothetical protein BpHYR1_041141 [Brachionus plicatilis]|uniref:Uncharacterized protein n=1 Tax=Brachionus plicatilis TaxID=10195 RepID=A0A3M7QCG8_BRAPC|nr:hypothetical protein BpHYR1_041141 [Brachionus plicatilis]
MLRKKNIRGTLKKAWQIIFYPKIIIYDRLIRSQEFRYLANFCLVIINSLSSPFCAFQVLSNRRDLAENITKELFTLESFKKANLVNLFYNGFVKGMKLIKIFSDKNVITLCSLYYFNKFRLIL